MLTYISVYANNNPYLGGIVIKSSAQVTEIGETNTIEISRRKHGTFGWKTINTIPVNSVDDFNFEMLDVLALSGTVYDYQIEINSPTATIEFGTISNITCYFEGLFIGDFNQCYIAQSNYKTETKKNMAVEYITTLAGKYPYRVSNAELNYSTGTSAGLFLELSKDKKTLLPDTYHEHSNRVMEFLCDGNEKILKTHDGQGWYVSIDKEPSKVYSDFLGMNALQFSWTDIGEFPAFGMAVVQ